MNRIKALARFNCMLLALTLTPAQASDGTSPVPAAPPAATPAEAPPAPVEPEPPAGSEVTDAINEILRILEKNNLPIRGKEAALDLIVAIARVADPAARVLGSDQTRQLEDLEQGQMYDVGLHLTRSNRTARVTGVIEDSSAAQAGVQVGDVLLAIGDEKAAALNIAQISERLRGLESETVECTLQSGEDEPRRISLEKTRLQLSPVEEVLLFPGDLGYIRVNGLFKSAGAEIVSALLSMIEQDLSGVVIDLRGADGRDVKSAVDVASMMATPRSTLFSFRDADDRDLEVHQAATETPLGMPVMILVDERTTGAAELLAAVLSGAGRGAMLIGRPTAGDPVLRDRVPLEGGQLLYLATRRLVVAGGTTYDGHQPVVPDVEIDPRAVYPDFVPEPPILTDRRETTREELETRHIREEVRGDIALTRAVDVLLGLKALNIRDFGHGSDSSP